MGYPMTWRRLVMRNGLSGDYAPTNQPKGAIAGDMRRLEKDSRDDRHGAVIAAMAGVDPEVARRVLDAFFEDRRIPTGDGGAQ